MFDKQIRLQMECNFKLIQAVGHYLNVFLAFFILPKQWLVVQRIYSQFQMKFAFKIISIFKIKTKTTQRKTIQLLLYTTHATALKLHMKSVHKISVRKIIESFLAFLLC